MFGAYLRKKIPKNLGSLAGAVANLCQIWADTYEQSLFGGSQLWKFSTNKMKYQIK